MENINIPGEHLNTRVESLNDIDVIINDIWPSIYKFRLGKHVSDNVSLSKKQRIGIT